MISIDVPAAASKAALAAVEDLVAGLDLVHHEAAVEAVLEADLAVPEADLAVAEDLAAVGEDPAAVEEALAVVAC